MKGFTSLHEQILEEHAFHYESLKTAGFMRNIDRQVFEKLQTVYREAVGPEMFTHWCGECVSEMVYRLYTAFNEWKESHSSPVEPVNSQRKKNNRG